jgi:hypothetical protein
MDADGTEKEGTPDAESASTTLLRRVCLCVIFFPIPIAPYPHRNVSEEVPEVPQSQFPLLRFLPLLPEQSARIP